MDFDRNGNPARCPECGQTHGGWQYSDGHEPIPGFHGWECDDCGHRIDAEEST